MDFIIRLIILIDEKSNSYNSILIIINWSIKIIYYRLIKIAIDILDFAKVIINIKIKYYSLLKLIIIN